MTDRLPPQGYDAPSRNALDSAATLYWLDPQSNWDGATPLFMVMKAWPGGQTIVAERCYRIHGIEIVDALRKAAA